MKLNVKDIAKREIIGLETEIIDSKNKSNIGIKGKIIDETKSTIIIKDKKAKKRLLKNNITLKINNITIKGKLLQGKPKERIKK
ncbi:ribonuclease P protein subunit [Candidatus Woesearchaeota archaeon]|nr:ribonuclease P protein subunit [Candidatus Woesearchaeota archaeon]